MSKVIGWSVYENIGWVLPNIDYGGHSHEEAYRLVSEGLGRWAIRQGGVFAFVPLDYELKDNEHFLTATPSGFVVNDG